MSDAPRPPSAATPPPTPPYAAPAHTAPATPGAATPGHPAPYPTAPPTLPPYAQGSGYAQQPYPGAPPVWTTAPTAPTGSKALAGTALGLAIFGAAAALVPFGIVFSWLFLLAAIVLAIIALVRRAGGRGMSIAALVVSGAGIVIAALWGVGFALFGTWLEGIGDSVPFSDDYSDYSDETYPVLGVDDGVGGSSRDDALPFGTTVVIVDESTGDPVWELTVGAPQDVTATASVDAPLNGAYLAVPIEITNVTETAIDPNVQYEYTAYAWLLTGDGGRAESTYVPGASEQYPQVWDVAAVEPGGTATYYETFDVAASVAGTGYLVLDLDSDEQVFWGP